MPSRVFEAKSEDSAPGDRPGKIGLLVALPALIAAGMLFSRLDGSKKRFIIRLARQVPYLPGRYYV